MQRDELERLSKDEPIELVPRMQRPAKTSRTSSKPPSTDRKEQRERSKPGGAKPGHEGHSRSISDRPGEVVEHRPDRCHRCAVALGADLPAEAAGVHERIELPGFVCRSRRRVDWWEFSARLLRPLCLLCSTEGITSLLAAS